MVLSSRFNYTGTDLTSVTDPQGNTRGVAALAFLAENPSEEVLNPGNDLACAKRIP